ncbi:MAG: hypothetical protein RBT63_05190 [Bdellovibrionales bacterium]|jgi:hypothetical protein|nr:hypothetical protein [Bdellovibrionales bacterium]
MKKKSVLQNEKGIATVETIPLLLLFVILLSYSMGAFGVIHTGILNSIAARAYAFETMRNRTNVTYFRDNKPITSPDEKAHYIRIGNRIHGILQEKRPGDPAPNNINFRATERPLRVGFGGVANDGSRQNPTLHNETLFEQVVDGVQTQVGVSPVWVMTQYGICLNVRCGD